MNFFWNRQRTDSSRLGLFSFSSLVFHAVLVLFFAWLDTLSPPEEKPEGVVITMVELDTLSMPPQNSESTPADENRSVLEAFPKTGAGDPGAPPQPEEPVFSKQAPVLDPELDEEIESFSGEHGSPSDTENPSQTLTQAIGETEQAPSVSSASEPDTIPQPGPLEETPLNGNSGQQIASTNSPQKETAAPDAPAETRHAVSEAPVQPVLPATEPVPPSVQEPAKPSELQDEPKSPDEKLKLAENLPSNSGKNPAPVRQPPAPKPSKEKVKQAGLLGLLKKEKGNKTVSRALKPGLGREKNADTPTPKTTPLSSFPETDQKMAQLKNSLLSSEQNRLMKRNSSIKRHRSQIKIVHGSGRNYGIISSAIEQKRGRLTTVYNEQLLKNPKLQGNLIVEFTIAPDGTVTKSQVLTSSFSDPRFEKALIQAIRRWKFPTVKHGETTVLYPLSFFPSS